MICKDCRRAAGRPPAQSPTEPCEEKRFMMGKRSKGSAEEPMTDLGKPFNEMSGEEKGREFDASHSDPKGYAYRNFGNDNQSRRQGRHAK